MFSSPPILMPHRPNRLATARTAGRNDDRTRRRRICSCVDSSASSKRIAFWSMNSRVLGRRFERGGMNGINGGLAKFEEYHVLGHHRHTECFV